MSVHLYRWAWSQEVAAAPKVSAAAAKAALLCLVEHAGKDGWAWPAVERISDMTALDQRTVRRALAALVAQGIALAETRHRATTRYRLGVLRTGGQSPKDALRNQPGHHAHPQPGQDTHPEPRHDAQANDHVQPGHGVPDAWAPCPSSLGMVAPQPRHHAPRTHKEPIREPIKEPISAARARVNSNRDDGFEEWWQEYPRKVQKDAARKEYVAALKRGPSPADLLVALRRQRWSEDPRYIPYPERWLKRGSWQDDPGAAAPPAKTTALEQWHAEVLNDDSEFGRHMREGTAARSAAASPHFDIEGEAEEMA